MDPNKFLAEKRFTRSRVKDWEIIADNLSKAGWSWGCVSAIDSRGRTANVWMRAAKVVGANENASRPSMQEIRGRSGLLTHIAATESVSLCVRMKY